MDFLPPLGYFEIRGSRALSYSDTPEVDGNGGNLKSMSAMPYYQSRSHEELRIEDFEIQKRSSFLNQNQGNTFQKSNSLFGPNPSPQPSSWSVFGTATAAKPPFGSTGFGVSPFSTSGCSTGNAFVHQDPRVSDFVTSTANVFSSTNNSGGGSSTNTFRFPSATLPEGLSISPLKFSSIPGFSVPYAPGFGMGIPSTPVPWSSLSFDGSSLSGPLNNRGPTTSGFASYSTSTSGSSSIFGVQTSLVSQGSTATEFQGSRITPQASTGLVEENSQNPNSFENIQSISAESSNKDKSHEELRLEYYGLGDKGRCAVLGDPFYRSSGLLTSDTPSNIFCDCTAPSSKQSNGYSPFQPFKSTFSEHERENLVTPSNTNSTAPTHPPFANPFSQAFTLQPPTSGPTLISKLNPPTLIPPTDPMFKNNFECSKTSTTSTTLSLGPFSFPKPSVIISPLIQSTLVTSSDPWSCLVNNASQPQQTVEKVGSLSTNELNKSQAFALQPPTASFGPTFTSNPNPLTLIPHVALMYIVPSNITSTAPTHPPFVNPLSQAFTHQPPTSSGPTFFSNLNPPTLIPSTDLMLKNSCECSKTSTAFATSSVGTFSFSEPSIIISPSIQSTPVISSDPWSCLVNNTSQSQQAAEKVGSLSTNDLNKSSQGKADGAKDNFSSFQLNENSSRLTDDTATQLLNRHEDEVSATTERHEADVAALLPKLPDEEYYTEPSLRELAAKEMAEPGFCSQVKDFVVGRQGYGSIKFLGETDIRHVDLESVVQFNNRQVMIYPDKRKKPQVGQKLNKAAEVTLLNVKCIDKKTGKQYTEGHQLEKYEEKLIRKNQEQGMEFVSYDPVEGEWKFRVQHF